MVSVIQGDNFHPNMRLWLKMQVILMPSPPDSETIHLRQTPLPCHEETCQTTWI